MNRLLRPLLSIALLAAVVWYARGVGAIVRPILGADLVWVVASFTVMTLDRVLMTFKWTRLLRGQGEMLGVLPGLKIYCAAMIAGQSPIHGGTWYRSSRIIMTYAPTPKYAAWPTEYWPAYNDYQAKTKRELPVVVLERD